MIAKFLCIFFIPFLTFCPRDFVEMTLYGSINEEPAESVLVPKKLVESPQELSLYISAVLELMNPGSYYLILSPEEAPLAKFPTELLREDAKIKWHKISGECPAKIRQKDCFLIFEDEKMRNVTVELSHAHWEIDSDQIKNVRPDLDLYINAIKLKHILLENLYISVPPDLIKFLYGLNNMLTVFLATGREGYAEDYIKKTVKKYKNMKIWSKNIDIDLLMNCYYEEYYELIRNNPELFILNLTSLSEDSFFKFLEYHCSFRTRILRENNPNLLKDQQALILFDRLQIYSSDLYVLNDEGNPQNLYLGPYLVKLLKFVSKRFDLYFSDASSRISSQISTILFFANGKIDEENFIQRLVHPQRRAEDGIVIKACQDFELAQQIVHDFNLL